MSSDVQFSIKSLDGRYDFPISDKVTVGRDSACDVVIPESSLSRNHARFFVKGAELFIQDLGSTNGTFVNGEQLATEAKLIRYNDIVRFDVFDFTVFVELASSTTDKAHHHSVAEASAHERKAAPRSWAVNENVGHGTVVVDLGSKSQQGSLGDKDEPEVDSSLLENIDQPVLIGIRGPDQGSTIELAIKDMEMTVWQLGRSAEMDIVIDDPSVSEHQAQIIFEQGTWKLVDVISTNATYVNGEKILTHYLSSGDKFTLGESEYMFRASNKTEIRPASRPPRQSTDSSKGKILTVGAVVALLAIGLYFFL